MSHLFLSHAVNLPVVKPSSRAVPERSRQEIQSLLKHLSHELPEDDYFDDFLAEFQQRQREELLQKPSWSVTWERVVIWLSDTKPWFCALAMGCLLVGIGAILLWG